MKCWINVELDVACDIVVWNIVFDRKFHEW